MSSLATLLRLERDFEQQIKEVKEREKILKLRGECFVWYCFNGTFLNTAHFGKFQLKCQNSVSFLFSLVTASLMIFNLTDF